MTKILPKLKVSIIIPVYNGADYLKEAIDSAIAQTYKNLEIIVVNDGSNDNGETERIALSYGNKLRYFSKPNGGVASALNLAIREMTGEYFSWLSHDDLYLPEKIEYQIKLLNSLNNPDTIIYGAYEVIDYQGKSLFVVRPDTVIPIEKCDISLYPLLRGLIHGCSLLIPTKYFHEIGVFDESLLSTQDYALWFEFLRIAPIKYDKCILIKSRVHPNQGTHKITSHKNELTKLWTGFITKLSAEEMTTIAESPYLFLHNTSVFLKTAPCDAYIVAESMADDILTNIFISVIMPMYNRSHIISESIESVLNQTHKNLELILVDDGSTDNISSIIEQYKKDSRVKYFRLEENSGASAARNIGIKNATGEYIAFIDSDDLFVIDKLEIQLKYMLENNELFSHTSYQEMDLNRKIIQEVNSGVFSGHVFPQIISQCIIATPTVMGKSYIFKENKFPEDIRIGEDVCLWISIANKYNIGGINLFLSKIRVDYNNSTTYNPKKFSTGLINIAAFVMNNERLSPFYAQIVPLLSTALKKINPTQPSITLDLSDIKNSINDLHIKLNFFNNIGIIRLLKSLHIYGFAKTCFKIYEKIWSKIWKKFLS